MYEQSLVDMAECAACLVLGHKICGEGNRDIERQLVDTSIEDTRSPLI
jgi:hypothetical protein